MGASCLLVSCRIRPTPSLLAEPSRPRAIIARVEYGIVRIKIDIVRTEIPDRTLGHIYVCINDVTASASWF